MVHTLLGSFAVYGHSWRSMQQQPNRLFSLTEILSVCHKTTCPIRSPLRNVRGVARRSATIVPDNHLALPPSMAVEYGPK
jgi:hypothetical protein